MRPDLKALRVASTREGEEGQDNLWELFKAKYPGDPMIAYLNKNWLTDEERPKWAAYHRQVRHIVCQKKKKNMDIENDMGAA